MQTPRKRYQPLDVSPAPESPEERRDSGTMPGFLEGKERVRTLQDAQLPEQARELQSMTHGCIEPVEYSRRLNLACMELRCIDLTAWQTLSQGSGQRVLCGVSAAAAALFAASRRARTGLPFGS